MASIRKALKQKTPYTTKHGLTIPYADLRKIKQTNDKLDYLKKKLGYEVGERIKTGSLANDHISRLRTAQRSITLGKYMRIRQRYDQSPSAKLERSLKYWKRRFDKITNEGTSHNINIDITTDDITMFKEGKIRINVDKLIIFKDNLFQTLENAVGVFGGDFEPLKEIVDRLSAFELHRLATDYPDLIDYIYYDPDFVANKIDFVLSAIRSVSTDKQTINMANELQLSMEVMRDIL